MNDVPDPTLPTRRDDFTEQMDERRQVIDDKRLKLGNVRKQRLRAEQDAAQCTRETERRIELLMSKGGLADVLQQLGDVLQEERQLSDQLNARASEDRSIKRDLEERSERLKHNERSLSADILEVRKRLAEAKARNVAAEASIHTSPSLSK